MDIAKLKAHLESEEGMKDFKEWWEKRTYDEHRGLERISKILDPLPKKELKKWVKKLLKWEEKWEDMKYDKHHVETSSTLFNCFIAYTTNNGKRIKKNTEEDFLASVHKWKGYTFKLYVGQGSFWRILKKDKVIFQST
jgi:hypothetical protein